ncbi:MAG TPA: MarR family transcriptional regulator [Actinomycetota bacterium]|jgi:DNA-binding MarR family transcriptional regulator|nr:MarR family transcriptional regulator [Actinomycetota bacterium]
MATPWAPDDTRSPTGRRAELLEQLAMAGRASSVATVMFHTAVAAKQGLSASEEKALDLLERSGPLTAGELARQSGLAPASVTGLINRLEQKGFARRIQNPSDRRSILVEVDVERMYARVAPLFANWARSLEELYAGYSDEQLEVILHFLTEAARRQQEATTRLTGDEELE